MNRPTPTGYHPRMSFSPRRPLRLLALGALVASAACAKPDYSPLEASTNETFFQAALKALNGKNWTKASKGFEQLTFQLPARDPMLPRAYFYLGVAHQNLDEFILAAQAFSRVPENFPEDTLAPLATFQAAVSYSRLWRRPDLDSDYGVTALSTYQSFLAAYPDSPLRDSAQAGIDRLNEMFAQKNLETGDLYAQQRAYDSSIIYYKDILAKYPQTKVARKAMLGLVKAYKAIGYRDDAADICATLRAKYPKDEAVVKACGPAPVAAAPAAPAPAKP